MKKNNRKDRIKNKFVTSRFFHTPGKEWRFKIKKLVSCWPQEKVMQTLPRARQVDTRKNAPIHAPKHAKTSCDQLPILVRELCVCVVVWLCI